MNPVDEKPEDVVQRQLEAYNAHDLEGFVATYGDAVQVFLMPNSDPVISGKAALAGHYGSKVFTLTGHRAEILGRIAVGSNVIDHERVYGLRPEPFDAVAVYDVRDGLIQTVWLYGTD